jgi:chromosome segregation ATPase
MKRLALFISFLFLIFSMGCQGAYYAGMEKLGYDKREILADRVENARESQQDAKEQFSSALERYKSVISVDGGKLEEKYEILSDEYDDCEARAEKVRDRIDSVEDVASALFKEWAEEINQYTSTKLKADSRKKLSATKARYAKLIKAMKRASSKMDPVLAAFKDQVLYLKHNLNAKAIAALEGELTTIRTNVDRLVKDMEASIAEADAFIKTLE